MNPTPSSPGPDELLRHADFVRGLARALVTDPGRAEDLSQAALSVALESPPAHGGNLRGWFAVLLRNLSRTGARSDRRRRAREAAAGGRAGAPAPDEEAVRSETRRRLVEAVLALEEPLRTVLVLRYFRGLGPVEIAARTGISPKTVSSRHSRGLQRLRSQLERGFDAGDIGFWSNLPALAAAAPRGLATATRVSLGGVAVSTKSLLVVVALFSLLLGVGIGTVFVAPAFRSEEPLPVRVADAPAVSDSPRAAPAPAPAGGPPASPSSDPGSGTPAPAAPEGSASRPPAKPAGQRPEPVPIDERFVWHLRVETVDGAGKPYAGARVEFQDAEGRVQVAGVADSDGRVEFDVTGNGRVFARGTTDAAWGFGAGPSPSLGWLPPGKRIQRERIVIGRPDPFGAPDWADRAGVWQLFGGRRGHRNLRHYGGGKATESAVSRALAWLVRQQGKSGAWDGDPRRTALAVLAFLGNGETQMRGDHQAAVKAGLRWLLDHRVAESADAGTRALGTLALTEAWAQAGSGELKAGAGRGIAAIARSAPLSGPAPLFWETLALVVAERCGIAFDPEVLTSRRIRLLSAFRPRDRFPPASELAFVGARVFLRSLAEPRAADTSSYREEVQLLLSDLPDPARPDPGAWHFGALGTFQAGEMAWKTYNTALIRAVTSIQATAEPDPELAGSFPASGPAAEALGRVGATALTAMTMETYYRYLPIERK